MMTKKLSNKVAIVTGGARDIGKAIVKTLIGESAKVIFIDQNEENGKKTESEIAKQFNDKNIVFLKGNVLYISFSQIVNQFIHPPSIL